MYASSMCFTFLIFVLDRRISIFLVGGGCGPRLGVGHFSDRLSCYSRCLGELLCSPGEAMVCDGVSQGMCIFK